MKALLHTAAALLLAATLQPALAGRNCEARAPDAQTAQTVQRAMTLAHSTAQALDSTSADVVVLARAGQDLSKYRLHWSHLALAYRDENVRGPDGRPVWRVLHKLNQCGSATSDIYRQGLGEFFLDDLFDYQAALAVPTPEVQAALLPMLRNGRAALRLHTPAYNMLAYPWAQQYQQSNQWAIETLAMAMEPDVRTREQAQAWLRLKGYEPTTLRISALTRLGARATAANIAFDDHPNDKRYSDRIETVTVDSVFDWLQRAGLAHAPQLVR